MHLHRIVISICKCTIWYDIPESTVCPYYTLFLFVSKDELQLQLALRLGYAFVRMPLIIQPEIIMNLRIQIVVDFFLIKIFGP